MRWGEFGCCLTASGILLAAPGAISAPQKPTATSAENPAAPAAKPILSPLHAFLKIDPATGEFTTPDTSRPRPASGPSATNGTADAPAFREEFPLPESPLTSENVDNIRAALQRVVDEKDDGTLAAALLKGSQEASTDWMMALLRRFNLIGYLLLFCYPAWIVVSELFAWQLRRRGDALTEQDRRFHARQLRRRLALAASATATAALFWWAAEHSFWWDEPAKLLFAAGVFGLLLATSAALRLVIRRAASRYPVAVIQQLRLQQLALQNEVEELRKRLYACRVADGS